jgi:hypothetical protein
MLSFPRIGQTVRVRYNPRISQWMPLQDATGVVRIHSSRRPRNHGIEIAGQLYVIPAGNLFTA